ncbi:Ig heavy chain Mem5 isoform X1 [Oreochromis niloticus]|uniref:Ig heavy chain Mem5 isoform X1 n=1 Tax=Oreochromis niloticus TaxID=8128 RepID=UPI000DF1EDD6|nr:Ig heavy chain Mem5-like isoform X1 [Oreochromis niloticus]
MLSVTLMLLLLVGSCVYSIDLIQSDSAVVQPGQSVTITCQVSGYSLTDRNYATGWIRQSEGKTLEWILHRWGNGDMAQNNALKNKLLHHTYTSNSSVTLTGVNLQPEDTAVYYCVRFWWNDGYFDYWGKGTQVTVISETKTAPTVFPLVPCGSESGDTVTLGCLATGFNPPAVTFSWNKDSNPLTDFIQYPAVQKGNVYTGVSQIQVSRQDWDGQQNFQCAVNHTAGNAETPITKPQKVSKPNPPVNNTVEPTVAVYIPPQLHTDLYKEITLVCLVTSTVDETYKIEWSEMFGKTQGPYATATDVPAQQSKNDKKWRSMSIYTTSKANWDKKGPTKEYTCRVGVGPNHISKTVSSAIADFCDLSWDDITAEDDFGSLWSTASSFIFLFIVSLFYSIIISLLKIKRS